MWLDVVRSFFGCLFGCLIRILWVVLVLILAGLAYLYAPSLLYDGF